VGTLYIIWSRSQRASAIRNALGILRKYVEELGGKIFMKLPNFHQPLIVPGESGLNGHNAVHHAVVEARAGAEMWTLKQTMAVSSAWENRKKTKSATFKLVLLIVLGESGLNGQNAAHHAVAVARAGEELLTSKQTMVVSSARENRERTKSATSKHVHQQRRI